MEENRMICPYCMKEEIFSNDGICNSCYEKVGKLEQARWNSWRKCGYALLMAIACKIDEQFQYLEEFWEDMSTLEEFHFRRILCVLEMLEYVDDCLFLPATKYEIQKYKNAIKEYVDKKISYNELKDISKAVPRNNEKVDLLFLNFYSEFFSFWCGADVLDWSYSQYFEVAVANLKGVISPHILIEVMEKHFEDILSKPVRWIE